MDGSFPRASLGGTGLIGIGAPQTLLRALGVFDWMNEPLNNVVNSWLFPDSAFPGLDVAVIKVLRDERWIFSLLPLLLNDLENRVLSWVHLQPPVQVTIAVGRWRGTLE